ncbi:unnamed protein product [Cuscuta epithymum]|uniref:Uncharacterized protein n=1 Tax=Cuscuta epithymum TaxID=186058 RepID=A0AAV0FDS9_9ASTE|nr:unnamed protein product [Cuscuta epithymum]
MDGRSSGEEQSLNEEAKALITRNDVQVVDVGKLINAMQGKLGRSPELLTESAGGNKCCIFRAHKAFFSNSKISAQSYQPRAVSIGPYHHRKPRLKMMQEHKWRFLKGLIKRTENTGVGLEEYVKAVKGLEEEARKCYSEALSSSQAMSL